MSITGWSFLTFMNSPNVGSESADSMSFIYTMPDAIGGQLYALVIFIGSNGVVTSANITDPSNPSWVNPETNLLVLSGGPSSAYFLNDYLYVAYGLNTIYVVNATDPTSLVGTPIPIGTDQNYDITVTGTFGSTGSVAYISAPSHIYVATNDSGMELVTSFTITGPDRYYGIAVGDTRIFVVMNTSRLAVFNNVSTVPLPDPSIFTMTAGNQNGITYYTTTIASVLYEVVYILGGDSSQNATLWVYDVSDPSTISGGPITLTGVLNQNTVTKPLVYGKYLFTNSNDGVVSLFDIEVSGPLTPQLIVTYHALNYQQSINIRTTQMNIDNSFYLYGGDVNVQPNTFNVYGPEVTCVTGNTLILMKDGSEKRIKDIQRGDFVAIPSLTSEDMKLDNDYSIHPFSLAVAKVLKVSIPSHLSSRLVIRIDSKILKRKHTRLANELQDLRNDILYVTKNHPIYYEGARRPAKCFLGIPGIRFATPLEWIKDDDDDIKRDHRTKIDTFSSNRHNFNDMDLYDIQFETDSFYRANGLWIQSRCPRSDLTPLAKKDYFDPSMYVDDTTWDVYDQKIPLDQSPFIL